MTKPQPIFDTGSLSVTPGAMSAFDDAKEPLLPYLLRHQRGDWGELPDADKRTNDSAVGLRGRIFSMYRLPTGVKTYVITEADRSVTTVLLPAEY